MAEIARCSGPACKRRARAEGLCDTHYRQKRAGRELTPILRRHMTLARARQLHREAAVAYVEADPRDDLGYRHACHRLERAGLRVARVRARLLQAARKAEAEGLTPPAIGAAA